MTKKHALELIENFSIGYQEDATSKWSSEEERSRASTVVAVLRAIEIELKRRN